jgi:hypothetical protein
VSKLGFGVWRDSSPAAIEEVGWAAGDRRWVSGEAAGGAREGRAVEAYVQ